MRKVHARPLQREGVIPGRWIWGLGIAFGLGTVLSAILVFTTVRQLMGTWSGAGLPGFVGGGESETGGQTIDASGTPVAVQPVMSAESLPAWNGVDRVSILLMGLDYRDWEQGNGPPRTDSMMLVTIDPAAKTAGMLSIPRDLWVEIPGWEHNRINTAYFLGEANRLPGGGPGLAMDTVEHLLGVPIGYFAVIDFHAFERMIDEIGGVDILVFEPMRIAPIGRESIGLEAKAYHFDGAEALAYARARKTEGGDFDRAERQQQVAMAIRDSILNVNMIPVLLTKAPALYTELASGIRTNLSFDQMVSLALLALQIDPADIQRGVIAPPDMVTLEMLADGAEVLRPVPDQIRRLRDEIFTETASIAPSIPLDSPAVAAQVEGARLSILNGAGIEGLASTTADRLKAIGLNVVEVSNADRSDYDKSRIIVHNAMYPYTVRFLASVAGLSQSQVLIPVTPLDTVDVVLILGADFDPSQLP
jgi:LCP family protein required for cell wall assembly